MGRLCCFVVLKSFMSPVTYSRCHILYPWSPPNENENMMVRWDLSDWAAGANVKSSSGSWAHWERIGACTLLLYFSRCTKCHFGMDREVSAPATVAHGGCEDAGEPSVHACLFWGSIGVSFGQRWSRVMDLCGYFAWANMAGLISNKILKWIFRVINEEYDMLSLAFLRSACSGWKYQWCPHYLSWQANSRALTEPKGGSEFGSPANWAAWGLHVAISIKKRKRWTYLPVCHYKYLKINQVAGKFPYLRRWKLIFLFL